MASGYCWNDKHVANGNSFWKYVLNKVKTLYIPYLLCNFLFLFLNNFFVATGLYASSTDYLDLIGSNDTNLLHSTLTFPQIFKQQIYICLMLSGTELGGPTWFFRSLFLSLVIFASIRFTLNRVFKNKKTILIIELCFALFSILIAWLISDEKVSFLMFDRSFAAYPLLVIGGWLHRLDDVWNRTKWQLIILAIIAMGVLLLLNPLGNISMARCKIENPFFFLTVSLAGWFLLSSVSKIIPLRPLAKLGETTRSIVMWHMISMKLVTLSYIIIAGLPMLLLGSFPVIYDSPSYLWIIYSIVCTLIPYFMGVTYDRIKSHF